MSPVFYAALFFPPPPSEVCAEYGWCGTGWLDSSFSILTGLCISFKFRLFSISLTKMKMRGREIGESTVKSRKRIQSEEEGG